MELVLVNVTLPRRNVNSKFWNFSKFESGGVLRYSNMELESVHQLVCRPELSCLNTTGDLSGSEQCSGPTLSRSPKRGIGD